MIIDNTDKPHKDWAYFSAGKLVVDQCDVLIAVWDREPARGIGGTGDIVAYASSRVPTILIYPTDQQPTEYINEDQYSVEAYKEFNEIWSKSLTEEFENSKVGFLDIRKIKGAISTTDYGKMKGLVDAFNIWDLNAIDAQKRNKTYIFHLYIIAFIASLTGIFSFVPQIPGFELFKGIFSEIFELIFHVLEFFALIWLIVHNFNDRKESSNFSRWVYSRLWAEKMRLQIFKIACLLKGNELVDEDNGISLFRNRDLDSRVFLMIVKHAWKHYHNKVSFEERTQILEQSLVQKQREYHSNSLEKYKKTNELWLRANNVLFISAIIFVSSLMVHQLVHLCFLSCREGCTQIIDTVIPFLQIFTLIFPIAGAVVEGYRGLMDYEKIIGINQTMSSRFKQKVFDLKKLCRNEDELEFIFAKTEAIMLSENGEWKLLVKPPESRV